MKSKTWKEYFVIKNYDLDAKECSFEAYTLRANFSSMMCRRKKRD